MQVANMVVEFDKTINENNQAKAMHTGSIERFKEDIAQLQVCVITYFSLYIQSKFSVKGESLN
jgi:hypothetical protein